MAKLKKSTHGAFDDEGRILRDKRGRMVVTDQTYDPRKGDLYMEGTTKRRFALGDSIRTFRAGR